MAILPHAPAQPRPKSWTVADLHRRFGPIPFERIRQDPPPGSGTIADVIRIHDHEDRLYELVDGVLVQKAMGYLESWLAIRITTLLSNFVDPRELGIVTGEAGMIQLELGLVRIPDAAFVSWDRLPGGEVPEEAAPRVIPDLAVEVISPSNTRKEMEEKLHEYFDKGVRLVWLVRPRSQVVDVYTAPDRFTRLTASANLDGGNVLLGFSISVGELFRKPRAPGRDAPKSPGKGKTNGRRPKR